MWFGHIIYDLEESNLVSNFRTYQNPFNNKTTLHHHLQNRWNNGYVVWKEINKTPIGENAINPNKTQSQSQDLQIENKMFDNLIYS